MLDQEPELALVQKVLMFTKLKKLGAITLSGALLVALCAPCQVWARGGGGGGGGGRASGGGFSGGSHAPAAISGGASHSPAAISGGGSHSYSGGYSAGYRGTNAGAGRTYGANATGGSFSSRNFAANSNNVGAGAGVNRNGANRYGAYGGAGPYGMGYGGLGYGGVGGMGYGVGYPLFGMYGAGGLGMMGMGGMGGYGSGYGGGGGYGGNYGSGSAATPMVTQNNAPPTDDQVAAADSFDAQGEADFKAGNYQAAVQDWQHALVDTPHNGGAMLLLAQGLFASGQYQPAAGAVQLAMQMLPQDQWGNVVKHYTDLYPNNQNFTDQLRGLETARTANPNDPAMRFLLGYEYGYLGYPTQAIAEFDKGIALRPQDRGAVTMRNLFAAQSGVPALPLPAAPATPAAPGTPPAPPASIRPTS
jgi:hypothetical protein